MGVTTESRKSQPPRAASKRRTMSPAGSTAIDAFDALARLPELGTSRGIERGALQLPERLQRIGGAHPVLGPAAPEHRRGRSGPRSVPDPLDVRRADHRDRHAGDPLGEDDVVGLGGEDRLLVGARARAFGGGDEAGAASGRRRSRDRAPRRNRALVTDARRRNQRHAEVGQLGEQLRRAPRPAWPPARLLTAMSPSTPPSTRLLGPLRLGDVVVDDAPLRRAPDPPPSADCRAR